MNVENARAAADALAAAAWEIEDVPDRVEIARHALAISLDCVEGHLILADAAMDDLDLDEARTHFERAVAAGERILDEDVEHEPGVFWEDVERMPYVRARGGLAHVLCEMDDFEAALDHWRALIALNPNDDDGFRYRLLYSLIEVGQDEEAAHLLGQYEGEVSTDWAYGRVLLAYRAGDERTARRMLRQARLVNRHLPELLLGRRPMPDPPEIVTVGGEDDAASVAWGSIDAWRSSEGALQWLERAWQEL